MFLYVDHLFPISYFNIAINDDIKLLQLSHLNKHPFPVYVHKDIYR